MGMMSTMIMKQIQRCTFEREGHLPLYSFGYYLLGGVLVARAGVICKRLLQLFHVERLNNYT
jgi:hypothetical protein